MERKLTAMLYADVAEFASVVTALKCPVAAQWNLAEPNRDLPENKKLQFRIGVNLCDIIVDRNGVYGYGVNVGNGVNVAVRLESLAEPGGICFSGRVLR